MMSFSGLKVLVAWIAMERQKALRFYQKDLHLCSDDERLSYGYDVRVSN